MFLAFFAVFRRGPGRWAMSAHLKFCAEAKLGHLKKHKNGFFPKKVENFSVPKNAQKRRFLHIFAHPEKWPFLTKKHKKCMFFCAKITRNARSTKNNEIFCWCRLRFIYRDGKKNFLGVFFYFFFVHRKKFIDKPLRHSRLVNKFLF